MNLGKKIYSGINKVKICFKCGNKFLTNSSNMICPNCLENNTLSSSALKELSKYKRIKRRL